jgi:uncharacterized DUF497 family protein
VRVDFDENKSRRNAWERRLPFSIAADFDFSTARVVEDQRNDYSERRFVALGYIGSRLHVLCFTPIINGIRVISLRKANRREVKIYDQEKPD